jgi:hypothetical protein
MANMEPINGVQQWVLEKTYTGAGNQEIINLPKEPRGYTIQLSEMDGTCKVAASIDGLSFEDWEVGLIGVTTIRAIVSPVRYLRVSHGTAITSKITIWGY